MTLYYEDDYCTIYHADCLELFATITTTFMFDVVVTDPPYGMSYQSGWGANHKPITGDNSTGVRDAVLEALEGVPMLVFGRWSEPRPTGTKQRLIWSKAPDPGMGDLSSPWGNSDEEIYVIGDGWESPTRKANVLTYKKPAASSFERAHPTPKPVDLMRDLIMCCPPGVVLDPFMGSGTTLRAAKDLGRKSIGIELDESYCEIAARRLAQEVLAL